MLEFIISFAIVPRETETVPGVNNAELTQNQRVSALLLKFMFTMLTRMCCFLLVDECSQKHDVN